MKWLYGYAVKHPDEQCAISPDDPTRTLCGRDVVFLPSHDEDDYTPTNLHERCRELIFGKWQTRSKPDPVEYGTCPVCVGAVPVFDGKVQGHGQWTYTDGVARVSEVRCAGEGQPPEVDA